MHGSGLSIPTTRKVVGRVKAVLDFAISRDLLATNAASGVSVIGRRDEGSKQIVPPSKECLACLIEVANDDFRVMLAFACATGVRASELYALRWRHIDLARGEVRVETRVDAYGQEDVPKSAAGTRTIPLGAPIVRMLKKWKIRTRFKKGDDLVFANSRGGYANHYNVINRSFNPLFVRLAERHKGDSKSYAPAPARFNWHALRHFAVSSWIEQGFSAKAIQTFAGHSSLQLTADI